MNLLKKFHQSKYFQPTMGLIQGVAFSIAFIIILAWANGLEARLANGAY